MQAIDRSRARLLFYRNGKAIRQKQATNIHYTREGYQRTKRRIHTQMPHRSYQPRGNLATAQCPFRTSRQRENERQPFSVPGTRPRNSTLIAKRSIFTNLRKGNQRNEGSSQLYRRGLCPPRSHPYRKRSRYTRPIQWMHPRVPIIEQ